MKTQVFKVERAARTVELDATVILGAAEQTKTSGSPAAAGGGESPNSAVTNFANQYAHICDFATGGIGKISKARDILFDRVVAVKSLQDQFSQDPGAIARFIEECTINAKLDHPAIVPVYGLGCDDNGNWNVAMKFIPGGSMLDFLHDLRNTYLTKSVTPAQERIALLTRMEYFMKVCEVVGYCHRHRIVHGDIKPENIMLGGYGELYLMDWGCAKPTGTKLEHVAGTLKYLPPEIFKNPMVSTGTDIYAMGVVLYELVTMRRGTNGITIANQDGTHTGEPGSPIDSDVDLTSACFNVNHTASYVHLCKNLKLNYRIKAIIQKAVHPDPTRRYADMQALLSDVRRFMFDEEVAAAPDTFWRKLSRFVYHHRALSIVVILTFCSIFLGSNLYMSHRNNAQLALQRERSVQQLQFQAETSALAGNVDVNYMRTRYKLMLLANDLSELYGNPAASAGPTLTQVDFSDPERQPADYRETPGFIGKVSETNAVRIHTGPRAKELPSTAEFARICRKIRNHPLDVDSSEGEPNPSVTFFERMFVAWADGTRDSYPGRSVDESSADFQIRWNVPKPDDPIPWTKPYLTGDKLVTSRFQPIRSRHGKLLGMAAVEIQLEGAYKLLCEISAKYPGREFYLIGVRDQILLFSRGQMSRPGDLTPLGVPPEKILMLRRRIRQSHEQIQRFDWHNRRYLVCGVPMTLFSGSMLMQLVEESQLPKPTPQKYLEEEYTPPAS